MKAKPHPEQGFRSCLGILSLVKSHGPERIEAAARRRNDSRRVHRRSKTAPLFTDFSENSSRHRIRCAASFMLAGAS
jgi:hypothetical protein